MTDRKIYLISDTHFNHDNIIKYTNRPFSSVDEMNSVMIKNWNATVRPTDIIYHLGDVCLKYYDILFALNGRKRLIVGNHDNPKDQTIQKVFEKIMMWRPFPEYGVILTHVPIPKENFPRSCAVNVHGHIHEKPAADHYHRNVSVERIGYTPINIEDVMNVR